MLRPKLGGKGFEQEIKGRARVKASGVSLVILAFAVPFLAAILAGCHGSPGASFALQQNKVLPAVVNNVADDDTLQVNINGQEAKVRLIGVNIPEIAHPDLGIKEEPYGREAAAYTPKRLAGRQVYLELDVGERDKYGRLLAYVWLEQPFPIGVGSPCQDVTTPNSSSTATLK